MKGTQEIIRKQIWMDAGDEPLLTAIRVIKALADEGLTISDGQVEDPAVTKERIKKEIAAELGIEFE